MLIKLIRTFWHDKLIRRLIAATLIISSLFSLVTSGVQVYWRYTNDIKVLNQHFSYIETGFVKGIEKSLWLFSFPQLEVLLDGLSEQSDIAYLNVRGVTGHNFSRGLLEDNKHYLSKSYKLQYVDDKNDVHHLGSFDVYIKKDAAIKHVLENIGVILVTNTAKTFLVSLLLFLAFYMLVGKHLRMISAYVKATKDFRQREKITLNRKKNHDDSLDHIANDLNELLDRVHQSHTQLDKTIDSLATKNEQLESFAYIASHDLKEPVRTIISYLALIRQNLDDELDPNTKKYMDFVNEAGHRIFQLLEDLLTYTRIEHVTTFNDLVNMNDVASMVIENLQAAIDEREALIHIDDLPTIVSNKSLITQALQNLLSNGIKYQPEFQQPILHLGVQEKEVEWQFYVKDNGIGIDEKYQDQIFAPFKRLHTQQIYKGSGVGLAITSKVVQAVGGKIWVESVKDKGSTFYFTIPKKMH